MTVDKFATYVIKNYKDKKVCVLQVTQVTFHRDQNSIPSIIGVTSLHKQNVIIL